MAVLEHVLKGSLVAFEVRVLMKHFLQMLPSQLHMPAREELCVLGGWGGGYAFQSSTITLQECRLHAASAQLTI